MTEVQSRDGSNEVADFELARALEVASGVPDPEVPCVTVADLGILRSVTRDESGRIVVRLTPTYSGCPAVIAIEMAVETALLSAGIDSKSSVSSHRPGPPTGSPRKAARNSGPMASPRRWDPPAAGALSSRRRDRLPALRLEPHHQGFRIRLDCLQGALPLRRLRRTLRLFQVHLRT
jgi:metal-sulfur cluster biosynthetic enzyme